jgi:acyl-CoA synthetase (NDP forming)
VQRHVSGGVEAILGMQNDPDFGPMIMVGIGGVKTELFNDVALRRAPVGPDDAREMINETWLGVLLDGFRGAPPADRTALEHAICALSQLVVDHGDGIESIDINPVLVLPRGQGCIAVDALILRCEGEKP